MTEDSSTIDLLRRIKSGDESARGDLYRRYQPRLRQWARGKLPSWARDGLDTDDIVQDALLKTLDKLEDFEPRHDGALQGWLYTILRNRIRDEVKKARRRPSPDVINSRQVDPSPSPAQEAIGSETQRRYEEALDRLRDEERAVIVMRVEWNFSYEMIALETSKRTANAARMAVSRALVQLAREMGHEA